MINLIDSAASLGVSATYDILRLGWVLSYKGRHVFDAMWGDRPGLGQNLLVEWMQNVDYLAPFGPEGLSLLDEWEAIAFSPYRVL